jgi:ATP-dependent DNA ligase
MEAKRRKYQRWKGSFTFISKVECMRIPIPISLNQQSTPFDDPEWIFEIKHDGFRALALIERGDCWFVSRKSHKFYGVQELATALAGEVNAEMAVLDGELVVTDDTGRTVFSLVMKRRKQARFFAFDLLWLNGEDLRALPLLSRKEKLKRIFPSPSTHALYVDHTKGAGTELYRLACQLDLEGIVAKRADSPYENQAATPPWIEIKNPTYSQSRSKGLFKKAGEPATADYVKSPGLLPARTRHNSGRRLREVASRARQDSSSALRGR